MRSDAGVEEFAPAARQDRWRWWPYFVVGYVALVLLLDMLASTAPRTPSPNNKEWNISGSIVALIDHLSPMPLSSLRWRPEDAARLLSHTPLPGWSYRWLEASALQRFDLFKFIFWFIVPAALCGRRIDLKAFGTMRWRKFDWYLLGLAAVLCLLVVCIVPFVPGLREYYPSLRVPTPVSIKLGLFFSMLLWTCSWIVGWEFMHRYFLLQAVSRRWPKYGWLLAPFFEWAYHLQKYWLEALGMALFSMLATQYVLRRRNVSLPFIAHLLIEVALPLTLLFGALNPLTWVFAK